MSVYMIEGEWSGYTSRQRKICHREYVSDRDSLGRSIIKWCQDHFGITYTDGTMLRLMVTELENPRKKRQPVINGYTSLIRNCIHHNVSSVAELPS